MCTSHFFISYEEDNELCRWHSVSNKLKTSTSMHKALTKSDETDI
jgi:hypothetical protein